MIIVKDFLEIYGAKVDFITGTQKQRTNYLKEHYPECENDIDDDNENIENYDGLTSCIVGKTGRMACILIWMPKFSINSNDIKVLSHECVHVAFKIATMCDLPFDNGNSENIAYLTDYYVGKFLNGYLEQTNNGK